MSRIVSIPVQVREPTEYQRPARRDHDGRQQKSLVDARPEAERAIRAADSELALQSQVEALRRQVLQLETEAQAWRDQARHLQAEVGELRRQAQDQRARPGELRNHVHQLRIEMEEQRDRVKELQAEVEEWRDRALRLQSDMDNYRKRQQRLARDQAASEREQLLGAFLRVVDDLERALAAPGDNPEGLRQGVELTHRAALQRMLKEGVVPVEAAGQPFDPNWHEAVATVQRKDEDLDPYTVVEVMEPGYRLGDQLLRPARVVVAV